MNEFSEKALRTFLNNVIARAEAVLEAAKKQSLHEPTVEFFRGQKIIAEQIMLRLSQTETPAQIIKGTIDKGRLTLYNEDGERLNLFDGTNGL